MIKGNGKKKQTPDLWEFNYNVNKHRKGHAPEGSGVPVGTEYHWYILAHQNVRKLDANTYSTAMRGLNINQPTRGQKRVLEYKLYWSKEAFNQTFQGAIHQLEQEEIQEKENKTTKAKSKPLQCGDF